MLFLIIFLVAQLIGNIGLVAIIRYLSRKCNLSLSIHNIPIVILWSMGLLLVMWLSVTHSTLYIMGGFWVALMLLFGLMKTKETGETAISMVAISVLGFVFWAQLLTVMVFYATHQKAIDENPELR